MNNVQAFSRQVAFGQKVPSSAEEGKAERSEAGVVLVNKIIPLISTTPALRATPPQLRRGVLATERPFCARPRGGEYKHISFWPWGLWRQSLNCAGMPG